MTPETAAALPLAEWESFYVIGIRNAWDTVAHLTLQRMKREQEKTGK